MHLTFWYTSAMYAATFVHILNTYRIHIAALYALMLWLYASLAETVTTPTAIGIAAFTSLLLGAYLINKYFNALEDSVSQPLELRASLSMFVVALGCILLPIPLLWVLDLPIAPYAFLTLLSFGYSVPIGTMKVKSIPVLKNVYAAGSWLVSIVLLIVYYGETSLDTFTISLGTLSAFFIALTYELLWDIRDIQGDAYAGHRTVPILIGIIPTQVLMLSSLATAWYLLGFSTFPLTLLMLGYLAFVTAVVREGFPTSYYHATVYMLIAILLVNTLGI